MRIRSTYLLLLLAILASNTYGKNKFRNTISKISLEQNNDSIVRKNALSNIAPILTATGNQIYCPQTSIKIVTDMTIVDPDDTGVTAVYIQISSGYIYGQDMLVLTGSHPTLISSWNANAGKLTLTGVSIQPTYIELIAAIKDIEFSNNTTTPTGTRTFSISIGQANYLPSNGHYYEYVPNLGITWTDAKAAAQTNNYYGIQGYLATITAQDEAQLAGQQAAGAGWIGGSDEQQEGIWKWMTGPETGLIFWNGNFQGSSPNFAFWNTGEPNDNLNNEDYAHITAPGVGIPGSWNDLSNTGDPSGNYQPKGYIVEYGGMPGDPIIHISTSTSITIPSITSSLTATRCGTGSVQLQATSNTGTVNWYADASSNTLLGTGNNFTTPTLTVSTAFYAAPHSPNCSDSVRIPIVATVVPTPILTYASPYYMCDESYTVIDVETSSGILFWYDSPTATNSIFLGTHFVVPNIHQDTVFYAEANYNGCLSDRVPILIKVYAAPIAGDENFEICSGDSIVLDAGNPGMTYLWSTGATSQTITTTGQTQYSVIITTQPPQSCTKTKNFTIVEHLAPTIDSVQVNNNIATITTTQSGSLEYSIDGINYQNANQFSIVEGGLYTAYVREKNGCGIDTKLFVMISIPEFFTPNNDNSNDVWTIAGLANYPNGEVKIYDRYGKLITTLNAAKTYWDGTLNGENLVSDDYWYVLKIDTSIPEFRGHFSLKR